MLSGIRLKYVFFTTEHLTRPQSSRSSVTPPSRQGRRKSSANWVKARTSLALSGELKRRARNKKWQSNAWVSILNIKGVLLWIDLRSLRSWCSKGTGESTLSKDWLVPLMHHDLSDRRSLILFWIIANQCTLNESFTV